MKIAFKEGVAGSEKEAFRDSLNAEVSGTSTNYEIWQIDGFSIDSLAHAYEDDPRLDLIKPYRRYPFNSWEVATSAESGEKRPKEYSLDQNYPNPFNPVTFIEFTLPDRVGVKFEIFDAQGRRVALFIDETLVPGTMQIRWDASEFSSGLYIYRLQAGDFVQSRSMTLVR